jgi:septal ring factor EnvC (AmiA/AmiB activator)
VIWAAPYRGYNKLIIVESPNHFHYAYGGNEITLVSEGDSVNPGMEIGRLGINPHDGVAKVFFFVYRDGKPVDPAQAPR